MFFIWPTLHDHYYSSSYFNENRLLNSGIPITDFFVMQVNMDLDEFKRVYQEEGSKNLDVQIPFLKQLAEQYKNIGRYNTRHEWTNILKVIFWKVTSYSQCHIYHYYFSGFQGCQHWFGSNIPLWFSISLGHLGHPIHTGSLFEANFQLHCVINFVIINNQ